MTLLLKIGGAQGIDGGNVVEDIASLVAQGRQVVVVHGGSDATSTLQQELGRPARFLTSPSGHSSRRTDREDLEAFAMATALVNRRLVEALASKGVRAFGLSGLDGGLVRGPRKANVRAVVDGRVIVVRDQWTGRPAEVRGDLLAALLDVGFVPVVAPVIGGPRGEMLNADGDRLAAALAASLRAEDFVILTNVPGLLEDPGDEGTLVPHIRAVDFESFESLAKGRMRKKLMGAKEALGGGVRRIVIADARAENPLQRALAGHGTVIEVDEQAEVTQ